MCRVLIAWICGNVRTRIVMKKSCIVRYTGELESCDAMSEIKFEACQSPSPVKDVLTVSSLHWGALILAKSSHEVYVPR